MMAIADEPEEIGSCLLIRDLLTYLKRKERSLRKLLFFLKFIIYLSLFCMERVICICPYRINTNLNGIAFRHLWVDVDLNINFM